VAHFLTAGLEESNGSLPPGGLLIITYKLNACRLGSSMGSLLWCIMLLTEILQWHTNKHSVIS